MFLKIESMKLVDDNFEDWKLFLRETISCTLLELRSAKNIWNFNIKIDTNNYRMIRCTLENGKSQQLTRKSRRL